jgi:signal transduction histidine kinase
MNDSLQVYGRFAHARRPKSYLGKFLLIAFLGVHVPLITLVIFIALSLKDWSAAAPFLLITLVATVAGTLATQLVQRQLLAPVLITSRALDDYVRNRTVPALPALYTDEAGLLMGNAQSCITHLDDLLRLKDNLLAVLSHDTRLPLTTITLASSISLDLLDEPEVNLQELRELTMKIRAAAARQSEMMNSLLTLARSGAGRIEPQWSTTTLGDLFDTVAANIRMLAESKGIDVELNETTALNAEVRLDVAKTEQVLNNLLANAVKFTPHGGKVVLDGKVDGESVEISVRDNGIGIDADHLARLFVPFTAAQRSGTAMEKGSGLGLWICKTFTELQGGIIGVESQPGKGSVFRLRLPRQEGNGVAGPAHRRALLER